MLKKSLQVLAMAFFLTITAGAMAFAAGNGSVVPATSATAAAAPQVAQTPTQSPFGMAVPLIAMFAVIYFLMIRPQQKRAKEQQEMISTLKQGDEILTSSGILGKVTGITDKVVTVEIADNVRVKMLKSQVSQVITQGKIPGNIKEQQ